ncbi:Alternative oxidase [Rhodotorula toruloides]|nr:Alternative oxidase [Rhodotorula toruloides]
MSVRRSEYERAESSDQLARDRVVRIDSCRAVPTKRSSGRLGRPVPSLLSLPFSRTHLLPHASMSMNTLARRTLLGAVHHPSPLSSTNLIYTRRSFATSTLLRSPTQTPVVLAEQPPTRSFQPHHRDAGIVPTPEPSTPAPKDEWKHSRPHEDWVLSHPVYQREDLEKVQVVHFEPKTLGDRLAYMMHADPAAAREAAKKAGKENLSVEELQKEGFLMSEKQWMSRILFLESIAGIRQPSMFFRGLVLGAQGVFFNMFFFSYLISVKTYTHIIEAIQRGEIPEWAEGGKRKVPQVAKDFWRLSDDATMLDLVRAVRADEAGHRFVNHTLANLRKDDINPVSMVHQSPTMQGQLPGFTRDESLAWARKVQEELTGKNVEEGEKRED